MSDMITRQQLYALRSEAGDAGDESMAETCDRALDGDADAITECERLVDDAEAQRDSADILLCWWGDHSMEGMSAQELARCLAARAGEPHGSWVPPVVRRILERERAALCEGTKDCVKCGREIPRPELAAGEAERCARCGDVTEVSP